MSTFSSEVADLEIYIPEHRRTIRFVAGVYETTDPVELGPLRTHDLVTETSVVAPVRWDRVEVQRGTGIQRNGKTLETLSPGYSEGLLDERPDHTELPIGWRYCAIDDHGGSVYMVTGSGWLLISGKAELGSDDVDTDDIARGGGGFGNHLNNLIAGLSVTVTSRGLPYVASGYAPMQKDATAGFIQGFIWDATNVAAPGVQNGYRTPSVAANGWAPLLPKARISDPEGVTRTLHLMFLCSSSQATSKPGTIGGGAHATLDVAEV